MNQESNPVPPQNILDMEDDILALKITVHALVCAISKCNAEARNELMMHLGFEANRMEHEFPELSTCLETLDMYFNQVVRIYKRSRVTE
ncbi:hypothetical protein JXC81_002246 [Salmonella enterica subsp. enterica serovar Urbana]|uniref:hypothetical protein n=1 Tax=Salmonella enterica TaxID=28901 RepID=UPI0009ABDBED|nr:hypothetical protein [Salmonella enterica]EDD3978375.1 hypothetical protein [Salmonella enterica subsp. enterica serovar Poona]EDI2722177.1 hypothetical protein [Salmonella enterica subsp. enterica serovar Rubislaw]EHM5598696.1 hypothetical protein [Salmonella enterica subsp. enterica serovar Urbana]EAO4078627.1 hypothetical protein [Salmonella enterica]EAO6780730.1 hypothetical protein [Salmonella enterica]